MPLEDGLGNTGFTIIEKPTGDGEVSRTLQFAGRDVDVAEFLATNPEADGRDAPNPTLLQAIQAVHKRVAGENEK